MNVIDAIDARRAYRSFEPVEITDGMVDDLAGSARLTPSCFNNQPWRFVFVRGKEALDNMRQVFGKGNEWCYDASMVVAVCTKKEIDCVLKNREYALFDTGMASAFMILRATEMGLVAHPIAGYNELKVKELLGVPEDVTVITLIMVGKRAGSISTGLNDKQKEAETKRPERLALDKFAFKNKWQ